jgi:hypothetical protein
MILCMAVGLGSIAATTASEDTPQPVNAFNFARAESDTYFAKFVKDAGLGRMLHKRTPTPVEQQEVIRMNQDTLYSSAVFDLEAAPVTLTLPETGKRFMSALIINQDHYALKTAYAPASLTLTREMAGTRYAVALIRTFADAGDAADLKAAHAAQDAVTISQTSVGSFKVPSWDPVTHKKAREALLALSALGGPESAERFGRKEDVEPISWLLATAAGWGGNPRRDAVYQSGIPQRNDGRTPHVLHVKDVPVDGFWSITQYNAQGYLFENEFKKYSLNNVSAKPNADGSYTIQFGGDPKNAPNFLPITPGWNYLVRLYRPRKEILDGSWTFPQATPIP